jgi:hypothetical protein
MAYKIGFVDNTTATGPNTLAHHNMLDLIRRFCAGDGLHVITGTPADTTKGKLTNFRVRSHGVTETWTITCSAAAADSGTFGVTGSVSGVQPPATVGVEYNEGGISFLITDGATDFIVGDQFAVSATANDDAIPHIQNFEGTGNGTLTGFFAYEEGQTEFWTVTALTGTTFSVVGSQSGAEADATVGTPYDNGKVKFTINAGGVTYVAGDVFVLIPQTWKVLRWDDGAGDQTAEREMILQGNGYTGDEEIFVGFRTNHLESADYYNMTAAIFTGYVPSADFLLQPGVAEVGFCGHNLRLDYWLLANGQRITGALKIATPVYEHFYAGKFLPYANPGQYPYPVVVSGSLAAQSTTRFSDTARTMGIRGTTAAIKMRFIDGTMKNPYCAPWCQFGTGPILRDTEGVWPLVPVVMMGGPTSVTNTVSSKVSDIYGELEGVAQITGFNNVVENTVMEGSQEWVVIQDLYRTGFHDYYALELK